ncbi:hypothetical protein [Hymenobacter terricola]|uniref:hypothetical protein n=1 Tax=Hymenobacter terricola TaxID=2819236 RepID=UPI001B30743B|nr:hypothetical protein [Hymenobacter terricola]
MRFRLLLLFLPALLAACAKTDTPVRLDFIGIAGLTSGNRTVNPSDTLSTRAYAVGNDNDLTNLRITVKYEPTRNPILYPVPISGYDPKKAINDNELVFLDSAIIRGQNLLGTGSSAAYRGGEFLFNNKFTARTTSGTELWQYTATDNTSQTASRAYRLTVHKPDSAAVFHNYTAVLRPVVRRASADSAQRRDQARVYLSLRSGLLLPKYALINNEHTLQANQQLIDLVCTTTNNTVILSAPADAQNLRLNPNTWPTASRRATQLRRTTLSVTDFTNAATTATFETAFSTGTPFATPLSTGVLAKSQVIAFRVNEDNQDYTGLILVSDLVLGTSPILTCLVKVQK